MDRSVDSIGSCSLDLDGSVNTTEWSEKSSTGTLLSESILPNSQEQQHLPSYLSLACTVNGYSTITNYDPVRLSKSRDASPHRPNIETLTPAYDTSNNLLSPPNLVPLPKMTDQKFFTTTSNTIESYCSKETRFSDSFMSKDTVDACYENDRTTFIAFDSKTVKTQSVSMCKNQETKSFIQQRVERLYGPGALAQGFLVMKRKQKRSSESEIEVKENAKGDENHSKSMSDKLLDDVREEEPPSMKQSASSPVLPVLRHLRPEFRAQLPIIIPRRSTESSMQKSNTVPIFKDEIVDTTMNGHPKNNGEMAKPVDVKIRVECVVDVDVKDGHYYIKILENEASRLLKLADECEKELDTISALPEDAVGKIRSASGKARLLVSQKMQQFKGLCTNNITQLEGDAFPTTNEDLQGFWDMVMLQVNQVDALFEEIRKLKKNHWKEIEPIVQAKSISNGNKSKKIGRITSNTSNTAEARKQREAREFERKRMIEEKRKAMKAKKCQEQNIEIFVPESS